MNETDRPTLARGEDFLNEAFLFHLSRTDIRHNFSPSFYGAYLSQYGADAAAGIGDGGGSGGGGGGIGDGGIGGGALETAGRVIFSVFPQLSVVIAVGGDVVQLTRLNLIRLQIEGGFII